MKRLRTSLDEAKERVRRVEVVLARSGIVQSFIPNDLKSAYNHLKDLDRALEEVFRPGQDLLVEVAEAGCGCEPLSDEGHDPGCLVGRVRAFMSGVNLGVPYWGPHSDVRYMQFEMDPDEPGYLHGRCTFGVVPMYVHAFRIADDDIEWRPHEDLPEVRLEQLRSFMEVDPECNFASQEIPGFEGRYALFAQPHDR